MNRNTLGPVHILQKYWGHPSFRPLQEEIIQDVLDGHDTLALLPTGGGKSICFQVPGMLTNGLTLVISPLIALMKDQVQNLNKRGIAATYVNSSQSSRQIDKKLQNAMDGKYKFLYCSPERLKTEMFLARLPNMDVQLVAVDEAHCISQWGYDFRPSYLDIHLIRPLLKNVPFIALTATATPLVKDDIIEKLELKNVKVFQKSFRRGNLHYRVIQTDNVPGMIMRIANSVAGTGIVYTRTRQRAVRLANMLKDQGIGAIAYHGGMKPEERAKIQEDWIENKHRVITTTNAFGMGIDKPDVRFVIHYNLPADLESYYQEAGRAGRDEQPAQAIAFLNEQDLDEMTKWVVEKYPDWDTLVTHYNSLCNYYRIANVGTPNGKHEFDLSAVAKATGHPAMRLYNSVKLLHNEALVYLDDSMDNYNKIRFRVGPEPLHQFKAQYPDYAHLINYLLRTYGGDIYQQDQRFLIYKLRNTLRKDEAELDKMLDFLVSRNIIFHSPSRNKPSLRFLQARHAISRNEMNWHKYNFLRQQSLERLNKMVDYVRNTTGCRSLVIQQYFGEEVEADCKMCDICDKKYNKKIHKSANKAIQEQIIQLLQRTSPLHIKELKDQLGAPVHIKSEELIREMIEKEMVHIDRFQMLTLNPKY